MAEFEGITQAALGDALRQVLELSITEDPGLNALMHEIGDQLNDDPNMDGYQRVALNTTPFTMMVIGVAVGLKAQLSAPGR